ncbi:MAG: hypothetical protein K8J08_20900 [Thermoanaerobaculia bacterium]|nr:hypothetical protein [Thermoanaerobaculia bacterium]
MNLTDFTPTAPRRPSHFLRSFLTILCLGLGLVVAGCQKPEAAPSAAVSQDAVDETAQDARSDADAGVILTEDFESGSLDSLGLESGKGDDGDEQPGTSPEPQEPQSSDH